MIKQYSIGGLEVECNFLYKLMEKRADKFICSRNNKSIAFDINEINLKKMYRTHSHLTIEQCEVIVSAQEFFKKALPYNKILLHAAALRIDNVALLFIAPGSGGKSTHISLWKDMLGEKVKILSDDRPIIGIINEKISVWDSPWSKISEINKNEAIEIKGICFLEKSIFNYIEQITYHTAIEELMKQYPDFVDKEKIRKAYEKLLTNLDIWKLRCNISIDAVRLAYNTMIVMRGRVKR